MVRCPYSVVSRGEDTVLNTQNIAIEALTCYPITYQSIAHIGQNANTIYKVTDKESNCYSLRIHLSKNDSMESIWSEEKSSIQK